MDPKVAANPPAMGDGGSKAAGCALVAVLLFAGAFPALAAPSGISMRPTFDKDPLAASFTERTLRTMEELGVPSRFLDRLRARAEVTSATDIYALPASDLDRDGSPEVIEWRLTYSLSFGDGSQGDPFGLGEEFETVFVVRSGQDGKKLWRKSYDDFVFPIDTVGADGRRGIVALGGLMSFFGESGESHLDFTSHKGTNGKQMWARRFTTTQAGDFLTGISENSPISIGFSQALPGKPMDIVLSLATEVSTLFLHTVAARVVVLDGSDGTETQHPNLDVGLNWYPYSDPVGDLDGDGLADYVVANNPGLDLGGPQEPPSIGGVLYARKGTDGSPIWTTSGLDLHDFAWADRLPDVAGSDTSEVTLMTPNDPEWRDFAVYLFDGETGFERWKKLGFGVTVPGDVDGDGRRDLLLGDGRTSFEKHVMSVKLSAFKGSGRKIYKKTYRWSFEGLPCPSGLCSGGWGYGWGRAGDVQPDRLQETFIYMAVQQDPGETQTRTILADGRDGRVRMTGKGDIYPLGGSLDGSGDDLIRSETKGGISVLEILDGRTKRQLLRTVIQRSKGVLPRSSYAWAEAFKLPGDRCGDLVVNMQSGEGSFYAVLDGGSGRPLWSRWSGGKEARPHFTSRDDGNGAC